MFEYNENSENLYISLYLSEHLSFQSPLTIILLTEDDKLH